MNLRRLGLLLVAPWVMAGCGRGGNGELILPSTPILSLATRHAVVNAPFLRLRGEPTTRGEVMMYLREGARVEVVSQTARAVDVEGEIARWYQVSHEGTRGWVFGAYLIQLPSVGAEP